MELIETPIFTQRILKILSNDEYKRMQWMLIVNRRNGRYFPGGCGIIRLPLEMQYSGQDGGLLNICYYLGRNLKLYLLIPFMKSDNIDITEAQLKMLRDFMKEDVL